MSEESTEAHRCPGITPATWHGRSYLGLMNTRFPLLLVTGPTPWPWLGQGLEQWIQASGPTHHRLEILQNI